MGKKIETSLNNIETKVESIDVTTKKFGPKLPSKDKGAQVILDDSQINTFTALAGILGILSGTKATTIENVRNIVNNTGKNNVFIALRNFLDNVDKGTFKIAFDDSTKDVIGKISNLKLSETSQNLSESIKTLNGIVDKLNPDDSSSSGLKLTEFEKLEITLGDLKEFLKGLNEKIIDKEKVNQSNTINNGKIVLDVQINNPKDIKEILDKLGELSTNTVALDGIIENLQVLNDLSTAIHLDDEDRENIQKNIKFITETFGEANIIQLFKKLYDSIPEGNKSEKKIKDLKGISSLFDNLIKLGDKKLIGLNRNIKIISKVLKDRGPFDKIIEDIQRISKNIIEDKKVNTALYSINNLFSVITSIPEIGIFKALRMKIGLNNIHVFLVDDLIDLIKDLKKVSNVTEKQTESLNYIIQFVENITKIGEISLWQTIKMIQNIKFIRWFVINDIQELFDEIGATFKKISENTIISNSLVILDNMIKDIINLADIDEDKFDDAIDRFGIITNMIIYDIGNIIKAINKLELTENTDKKLSDLINLFEKLSDLFETDLPSFKTIIVSNLKIGLIGFSIIPMIDYTTKYINKFNITNDTKGNIEKTSEIINKIIELSNIINSYSNYISTKNVILKEVIPEIKALMHFIDIIDELKEKSDSSIKDVDKIVDNVKIILKEFNKENGEVGKQLDKIINIKKSDIDNLKNILSYLDEFNNIAKKIIFLGKSEALVQVGLKAYKSILNTLTTIVNKINIDPKKIENLKSTVNEFLKIVIVCASVLLFAGVFMAFVPTKDVLKFTIILGFFIGSLLFIFSKSTLVQLKDSEKVLSELKWIIITSGLILLIGAAFITSKILLPAIGFILLLKLFIGGLLDVISYYGEKIQKDNSVNALRKMSSIILISGFMLMFAGLLMQNTKILVGALAFAVILDAFIFGLVASLQYGSNKIKKENLQFLKQLERTILVIGAIFIISSILFKFSINAILFAGSMLVFTGILIGGLWALSKEYDPKKVSKNLKQITFIAILSGLLLILAAEFGKSIDIIQALKFTAYVGGFIFAMILAINGTLLLAAKMWGEKHNLMVSSIKSLLEISLIVGVSGLLLILASKWASTIDIGQVFLFTLYVSGFIFAMVLAIHGTIKLLSMIAGDGDKNILKSTLKTIGGIMLIVLGAAAILILGGLVMNYVNIGGLVVFTLCLAGFIFALMLPFILSKKSIRMAFKGAKEFGVLLILSSAILIFGGMLFTLFPQLIKGTFLFAIVLGAFIFSISFILSRFNPEKLWPRVIGLAIIIFGTAAILLYAGKLFVDDPMLIVGVLAFAIITGLFTFAMSEILIHLSKQQGNFKKGLAAMVVIGIVTIMIAKAMGIMGDVAKNINGVGGLVKFGAVVAISLGAIKALSVLTSELAISLGNGISTTAAYLAIGVIIAMAGAIWIVADAMQKVVKAIDNLSKVKKIDKKVLLNNISAVMDMAKMLAPLITISPMIAAVSVSLTSMAYMMDKLAEAVKNYSELKVPVEFDKNGKPTDYRHLNEQDFKEASKNVSRIITVLGGTVIDTYNKYPEIFETNFWGTSKFSKVTKSLKTLAPLISSIARSVKDYADLKVVENWKSDKNGHLVPKSYRHLNTDDFNKAGLNVSLIIKTLGKAVISTYEQNPELFETNLFGRSKFAKVTKSLKTLAPLISSIARSVKDYADLKVVETWKSDKNGHLIPKSYRHLNTDDFDKASSNVQLILSTLGQAIINTYNANPKLYDSGVFSNSPFGKTVKANMKLGNLISKIGYSIEKFANFKVGINYKQDKNGHLIPTDYRELNENDFQKASSNVQLILSTLGQAIIDTYNANPNLYESTWIKNSPFTKTINANMKLGDMISKIGQSVEKFANFKVVDEYEKDKNGNLVPKNYRELKREDFNKASSNIEIVLTTLGGAIIRTYKNNEDMFKGWDVFGLGDSPFTKTLDANMKLAKLISTIGKAIEKMAFGKFEIDWDPKTGKATKWSRLTAEYVKEASKNIELVITTLGTAIITTYEKNKNSGIFDDGEDSKFAQASLAIGTMGNMISSIAKGLQDYANLKFPIYKDGKIIDYERLDNSKINEAKKNINSIIRTLGKTIIDAYNKNDDIFDDGKDSKFASICISIGSMGELIGNISKGIQAYANLKFPIYQNGKEIGFEELNSTKIDEAQTNITKLISVMGQAIIDLTDENKNPWVKDMFNMPQSLVGEIFGGGYGDNKFVVVAKSVSVLGEMISKIAQGVESYASMAIPTEWDGNGTPTKFVPLNDTKLDDAKTHIGDIITTIGGAIAELYDKDTKGMFDIPNSISNFFHGTNNKDNKFVIVAKSCMVLSEVISQIAQGVKDFASLNVPSKWDPKTGKPIEYRELKSTDFIKAQYRISQIITTIGGAIATIYKENKSMFDNPINFEIGNSLFGIKVGNKNNTSPHIKVISFVSSIAKIISIITKGIKDFAELNLPTETLPDGTLTNWQQQPKNIFKVASYNIGEIIKCLAKAVNDAYKENAPLFNNPKVLEITKSFYLISKMVNNVATGIKEFVNLSAPVFDEKTGLIIKDKSRKLNIDDFKDAQEKIRDILICVGEGVLKVANDPAFQKYENPIKHIGELYAKIGTVLPSLAQGVKMFATMSIPKYAEDGSGKVIGSEPLKSGDIKDAIGHIKDILTAIGEAIWLTVIGTESIFGPPSNILSENFDPNLVPAMVAANAISKMAEPVVKLAGVLKSYSGSVFYDPQDTEHKTPITLNQDQINSAKTNIQNILGAVGDAIRSEWTKGQYNIYKDDSNIIEKISKGINSSLNLVNGIVPSLKTLLEKLNDPIGKSTVLNEISQMDGDKHAISSKIEHLIDIIFEISKSIKKQQEKVIFSFNGEMVTKITNSFGQIEAIINSIISLQLKINELENTEKTTDIFEYIKTLPEIINNFINSIKNGEDVTEEKYKNIGDSISYINDAILEIQEQELFNQHTQQLDKYVKTINALDTTKLNKLNALVTSMNILSKRMGNIDKLTDAIAKSLATELAKLTKEINIAKDIINKAETIQKKRHELIKEQVKDIKEMMDKTLTIEIKQVDDNTNLNTGGGSGSYSPDSYTGDTHEDKQKDNTTSTSGDQSGEGYNNPSKYGASWGNDGSKTDGKSNDSGFISTRKKEQNQRNQANPIASSGANPNYGSQDINMAIQLALQNTRWTGEMSMSDNRINLQYSNI